MYIHTDIYMYRHPFLYIHRCVCMMYRSYTIYHTKAAGVSPVLWRHLKAAQDPLKAGLRSPGSRPGSHQHFDRWI